MSTLGPTGDGSAEYAPTMNAMAGTVTMGAVGGEASKVWVRAREPYTTGGVKIGLYSDATTRPGSLLVSATIAIPAGPTEAWYSAAISYTLVGGTTYWIAVSSNSGDTFVRYATGRPSGGVYHAASYDLPDPWPSADNTADGNYWCAYVEYAEGSVTERTPLILLRTYP
jgi:hypothetical protein